MDYVIYFIITIGILVFVHEFGHFAAAKLSKMRVDIFAIGFGKRLLGWNKINGLSFGDLPKDWDGEGNTDYRLCLLPLGGYVKIAGMVDESFDTKFAEKEPQPYEFRAKPTISKLFVITAGVLMNLVLTVLIFWGINFHLGKQVINTTTINKVTSGSFAEKVGFQSYDKILSINGKEVHNWGEIVDLLLLQNASKNVSVKVDRNGAENTFSFSGSELATASQESFFLSYYPTEEMVTEVKKDSPAQVAGFKAGDFMLSIDGIKIKDGDQVKDMIASNQDKVMSFTLLRDKDTILTSVKPGLDGQIGIEFRFAYTGDIEYSNYGIFGSLTHAFSDIKKYTTITFSMLKSVITGKLAFKQAFGGPIRIAQYAAKTADSGPIPFLFFLATLSLSLAIINILPFPVLDGGHFVIILLEGIFKKELPIKIKIAIQNTGFVLLLLLMAFIIYNDLISL